MLGGNLIIVLLIMVVAARVVNSFNKTKENRPGSAAKKSFDSEEPETEPKTGRLEATTPPKAQAPGTLFGSMSDMIAGAMENDAGKKKTSAPQGPGALSGSVFAAMNEGDSLSDGQCIGGSLPHFGHEGDDGYVDGSLSPIARQEYVGSLPPTAREGDEKPAAVEVFTPMQTGAGFAESHASFAAAQMRQAVVMKEILDKPVSMRRRRL